MKNVIVVSHSLIPSVLLCGHAQLLFLKKQGLIDYQFVEARKANTDVLSWADIVVFVRSESYLEAYVSALCKGKKHLVYVLDDDLLNLPDYVSSAKYYNIKGIKNNIKNIIKNCDTFLTPSPVLLEKYGTECKNSFLIDEPSLGGIKKRKDNEKIKIGFAGSIDRTQDINEILNDSLEEVIKKYKDKVDIEFMGAKPDIVDKYNLNYIPYQDGYKKYTQTMGEANWDIGLAPMPISNFHECKYFNKYVEYASYGIAGVYTNTKPYIFGINDRVNGLLVNNNKQDWINAISLLIEDDFLRRAISKKSLEEANGAYSLETLSKQFIEKISYDYVEKDKEAVNISLIIRVKILLAMIKDKIIVQRWRFPFWCVRYICLKLLEKFGLWKKDEYKQDWEL